MSEDLEMAELGQFSGWQPRAEATWVELRTEGSSEKMQKQSKRFQEHVEFPKGDKAVRNGIYKDLQEKWQRTKINSNNHMLSHFGGIHKVLVASIRTCQTVTEGGKRKRGTGLSRFEMQT